MESIRCVNFYVLKKLTHLYLQIKKVYLKLGTGWPCAGQNNTTTKPDFLAFHPPFKSPVNAGALLPTGSGGTEATAKTKKNGTTHVFIKCANFKEGTGYPCAGHGNTALKLALFLSHPPLISFVRAGALVPIGSNDYVQSNNSNLVKYLIAHTTQD